MENKFTSTKFEDTVQCFFYSTTQITFNRLEELCEIINKDITILSQDYIWHRDEFKLCVSLLDQANRDMPAHLTSTTCFGDNIDDEWFIVYLVLQLTSKYKDLIVQIEDNDGDFLLIEAADHLPSWANPETMELRVFIYQGEIHIISPEVVQLDTKLELQDAINCVTQKPKETKAANEIQQAILKRISCYPEKIRDLHHRALVTLPIDIAALLKLKQSLISPMVTMFCNHDMLDEKCFKNIKFDNCVTVPVLFTKYLYAMLMHSKLPRITKPSQNNKETTLGLKLACGFEIIMSKSSRDILNSREYNRFIRNLTKNGYFKDNIEGSKQHTVLLKNATNYFSTIECPLIPYYCNSINELRNTEEFNELIDLLKSKDNSDVYVVDDEEWLNINPDELNTFLNTHYGKKIVKNQESTTPQITADLANFLKKTSDFEGIEYVKEEEGDKDQIEFDSDDFVNCVHKMLNLVTNENNDTDDYDSDFSDVGTDNLHIEHDLDIELASKLQSAVPHHSQHENIMKNLMQSINEEGTSGPSSTLLKSMHVSDTESLDSDDER